MDEDNYIVLEVNINNNDLYLNHITDTSIVSTVTKLLIEKTKRS